MIRGLIGVLLCNLRAGAAGRAERAALPESYPDIARDSGKIVDHVLEQVRPGSIVLLHGSWKETSKAVEPILRTLTARGYRFVTVGELLSMQQTSPPPSTTAP